MEKAHKNYFHELFSIQSLFSGGLSIIFCALFLIFFKAKDSVYEISQVGVALAFVINFPHFLSSYVMLYSDFKSKIFKNKRFFLAAVIVPLVLFGFTAYGLATASNQILAGLVTSMYFFVGWHYVKQIFGCFIVTSAQRKVYYSKTERRVLLWNLCSLWGMSWVGAHVRESSFNFYGVTHTSFNLPPYLLNVAMWSVGVSALICLIVLMNKYIETGVVPPAASVVSILSLYAWYLPTLQNPGFAYLIPMFHSLQYLSFVWIYKKNETKDQAKGMDPVEARKHWLGQFCFYFANVTILGALAFEVVPKLLDAQGLISDPNFTKTPFLAAFLLFINIHHYFIDNVLWRSEHPEMKKYLMAPSDEEATPAHAAKKAA